MGWRFYSYERGGNFRCRPGSGQTGKLDSLRRASANWNIWRVPIRTGLADVLGASEPLISSSGLNHYPQFSPDGKQIAFVSDRSGAWQLWISDGEGRSTRQLTHLKSGYIGGVSWSPNGEEISFDARIGDHSSIFVIAAAGGEPQRITNSNFEERSPVWFADGKTIVYSSNRGGMLTLWRTFLDTHATTEFSSAENQINVQSPDGVSFIYEARDGYLYKVVEGQKPVLLSVEVQPQSSLTWIVAHDGVLFLSKTQPRLISFYRFSGGHISTLGKVDDSLLQSGSALALSPDGCWLLFVKETSRFSDIKIRYANGE